jgi:hypothetical protein
MRSFSHQQRQCSNVLTLADVSIWIFFRVGSAASLASSSNAGLIRKILLPGREVFPLTSVSTKLVELPASTSAHPARFMACLWNRSGIYAWCR